MKKGKLYVFAVIVGLVACVIAMGHTGFAEGVRNNEKCIANPDNWWCSLFGASND